jgi:hypothetical protein
MQPELLNRVVASRIASECARRRPRGRSSGQ